MSVPVDSLPRRNGELAFDAPWQPRVFGLAIGVVQSSCGGDWEPFRQRLKAAVGDDLERPYWESWTAALEDLLRSAGLLTTADLEAWARGSGAPS